LAVTPTSPVNALVREFIEGKTADGFEKDGYSVRWTLENGLGLVFVVVFPALLPLTYIPALLKRTKELYLALFQPYLESLVASLADGSQAALSRLEEQMQEAKWDQIFDRCLKSCEKTTGPTAKSAPSTPGPEEVARNVEHLKSRLRRTKGKTPSPSPSKSTSKLMRKWNDSHVTEEDMAALDYSSKDEADTPIDVSALVSQEAMGKRVGGAYEVADWDSQKLPTEEEILARREVKVETKTTGLGGGLFSRLSGKKTLTKEDLEPVLVDMEKHLMSKNVAKEISEKLCEAVGEALVGRNIRGQLGHKTPR
jgi:signal recognition particle receptor subunit alpha